MQLTLTIHLPTNFFICPRHISTFLYISLQTKPMGFRFIIEIQGPRHINSRSRPQFPETSFNFAFHTSSTKWELDYRTNPCKLRKVNAISHGPHTMNYMRPVNYNAKKLHKTKPKPTTEVLLNCAQVQFISQRIKVDVLIPSESGNRGAVAPVYKNTLVT